MDNQKIFECVEEFKHIMVRGKYAMEGYYLTFIEEKLSIEEMRTIIRKQIEVCMSELQEFDKKLQ